MRTTKYEFGFTLVELMVAVALLAMVLGFTGVIFKVSIESHRLSAANAEIMQKLRAITSQLNSDFRGLRKDAPLYIWFDQRLRGTAIDPNRYDQIMFFANGDFQSTQLYDYHSGLDRDIPSQSGYVLKGNVARIYYGQAKVYDVNSFRLPWQQNRDDESKSMANMRERILARRQYIAIADPCLISSTTGSFPDISNVTNFSTSLTGSDLSNGIWNNDFYEHDSLSLAGWKSLSQNTDYNNELIPACFADANRPGIDLKDIDTLHMLMAQGVGSFKIQWAYWDPGFDTEPCDIYDDELFWFPDEDPDGDDSTPISDSHFDPRLHNGDVLDAFGVYFNADVSVYPGFGKWYFFGDLECFDSLGNPGKKYVCLYPKALKFTFRLYDSYGLVEEQRDGIRRKGRTFTHIVYLE